MSEILYDRGSLTIALLLLALMVAAVEAGYRFGRRAQGSTAPAQREQLGTIQSSLIGILALMLGFTFSIALERFGSRSEAVVEEANAIGTAHLRTQLLPVSVRDEARRLLEAYTALRVEAAAVSLDQAAARAGLADEATALQEQLWQLAVRAAAEDPNPVSSGLFVQALNEVIDAFGRRNAELDRHVPELVLFLLFGAFIATGGIIGYTAGVAGNRPTNVSYLMVALVVLLMFMVMDLDRPRRGLIQVNTHSLVALHESMRADTSVTREH